MSAEISVEGLSFLRGPVHYQDFVPVSSKDGRWDINDSSYEDYFAPVELAGYPEGVLDLLEEQIGLDENNAGIDIGGGSNGVALRGLIKHGLLGKGLVTNMQDKRKLSARLDSALDHVSGNILNGKTWKDITGWVDENCPGGAGLVMHRPVGGMQDFTANFYKGAVHNLLDMLRPGGAMFTQVPGALLDIHRDSHRLAEICQSISDRSDIGAVVPTEATKPKYAVILKNF